jgi:methyl-accepting chemotaxis protein
MKWFSNLQIGVKFTLVVFVVLSLTAILGIFSIRQLSRVNGSTVDIATNWLPSVRALGEIKCDVNEFYIVELQRTLSTTEEGRKKYEKRSNIILDRLGKNVSAYEKLISSAEEQKLYQEFKRLWSLFMIEDKKIVDLSKENKSDDAVKL